MRHAHGRARGWGARQDEPDAVSERTTSPPCRPRSCRPLQSVRSFPVRVTRRLTRTQETTSAPPNALSPGKVVSCLGGGVPAARARECRCARRPGPRNEQERRATQEPCRCRTHALADVSSGSVPSHTESSRCRAELKARRSSVPPFQQNGKSRFKERFPRVSGPHARLTKGSRTASLGTPSDAHGGQGPAGPVADGKNNCGQSALATSSQKQREACVAGRERPCCSGHYGQRLLETGQRSPGAVSPGRVARRSRPGRRRAGAPRPTGRPLRWVRSGLARPPAQKVLPVNLSAAASTCTHDTRVFLFL